MRLLSLVLLDKYCFAIDYALKVLVRLQRFSGGTCALSTPPLTAHCASRAPPLEILAQLEGIPENLKALLPPHPSGQVVLQPNHPVNLLPRAAAHAAMG